MEARRLPGFLLESHCWNRSTFALLFIQCILHFAAKCAGLAGNSPNYSIEMGRFGSEHTRTELMVAMGMRTRVRLGTSRYIRGQPFRSAIH